MVERDKFEYAQEMKRPLDVPLFHYCIFFPTILQAIKLRKGKIMKGK